MKSKYFFGQNKRENALGVKLFLFEEIKVLTIIIFSFRRKFF